MRRFKDWLFECFLPAWTKASVYEENKVLRERLERQSQEIRELNAYIDGLEAGLRSVRRQVVIQNGGKP